MRNPILPLVMLAMLGVQPATAQDPSRHPSARSCLAVPHHAPERDPVRSVRHVVSRANRSADVFACVVSNDPRAIRQVTVTFDLHDAGNRVIGQGGNSAVRVLPLRGTRPGEPAHAVLLAVTIQNLSDEALGRPTRVRVRSHVLEFCSGAEVSSC